MNAQAHAFSNAQTFMVVYVWNNQEAVWLLGRKTKTLSHMHAVLRKQLYDSVAVMIHDLFSPAPRREMMLECVQHEFSDVENRLFF
jgi:hypothetical protein